LSARVEADNTRKDRPQTSSPVAATGWHGHGEALVVDDEPSLRLLGARFLESLGFPVAQAEDCLATLERLGNSRRVRRAMTQARMVLLDLTMPRMDGEETFRRRRQLRPQLPIILMSGYSEEEVSRRFAGLGLALFLQKPFSIDQLTARVQAALPAG